MYNYGIEGSEKEQQILSYCWKQVPDDFNWSNFHSIICLADFEWDK
jgi:hypothetical protein